MKCGHFPVPFYKCMLNQSLCHFLYYKNILVIHNEDPIGRSVIVLCLYNSCISEFPILKEINSHKTPSQVYGTVNICGRRKTVFNLEEVLIEKK